MVLGIGDLVHDGICCRQFQLAHLGTLGLAVKVSHWVVVLQPVELQRRLGWHCLPQSLFVLVALGDTCVDGMLMRSQMCLSASSSNEGMSAHQGVEREFVGHSSDSRLHKVAGGVGQDRNIMGGHFPGLGSLQRLRLIDLIMGFGFRLLLDRTSFTTFFRISHFFLNTVLQVILAGAKFLHHPTKYVGYMQLRTIPPFAKRNHINHNNDGIKSLQSLAQAYCTESYWLDVDEIVFILFLINYRSSSKKYFLPHIKPYLQSLTIRINEYVIIFYIVRMVGCCLM